MTKCYQQIGIYTTIKRTTSELINEVMKPIEVCIENAAPCAIIESGGLLQPLPAHELADVDGLTIIVESVGCDFSEA